MNLNLYIITEAVTLVLMLHKVCPTLATFRNAPSTTFKKTYVEGDNITSYSTGKAVGRSIIQCSDLCKADGSQCAGFRFDGKSCHFYSAVDTALLAPTKSGIKTIAFYYMVYANCSLGWLRDPYKNTCLKMNSTALTYSEAESYCVERYGGNLAVFDHPDTPLWLGPLMAADSNFTEWSDASPLWVGGYLLKGTTDEWQWINDGGVVDASLFNQASLNYFDSVDGGYLAMRFRGLFSPYRGTERFPFLCEITGQQRQN